MPFYAPADWNGGCFRRFSLLNFKFGSLKRKNLEILVEKNIDLPQRESNTAKRKFCNKKHEKNSAKKHRKICVKIYWNTDFLTVGSINWVG